MKDWFESLTGFREVSADQVRQQLKLVEDRLISVVNGKEMVVGRLTTPSLGELQEWFQRNGPSPRRTTVREIVGDVRDLHSNEQYAGSLFPVASQFNLLEMTSPSVTPEYGVAIYEHDATQGPACAIAAGGGTIYRNYFARVDSQTGQTAAVQIDCLKDLGVALGNIDNRLWEMRNGYAMATTTGLQSIADKLRSLSPQQANELKRLLRIGVQSDVQVTIRECKHRVSQAYCSALPVGYSALSASLWEPFARLVLEAAYEATLIAGVRSRVTTGNRNVFLTLLGGGAFGNHPEWIVDAIERALKMHRNSGLEVAIVSYGRSNGDVLGLVKRFSDLQD